MCGETGTITSGGVFPSVESDDVVLQSVSPSQRYMCQFVKKSSSEDSGGGGSGGMVKYDIRIWDRRGQLVEQIPIDSDTVHGIVSNDSHFTRIVWNESDAERSFLYEAEPLRKKHDRKQKYWTYSPVVQKVVEKTADSSAEADLLDPGMDDDDDVQHEGYYNYADREDYGEGLTDRKRPVLFICHWAERRVETVAGVPGYIAVSFATYTPDWDGVVFTGYDLRGERRLGLKYCMQRPCALYYLSLRAAETERRLVRLTSDADHNARTPVFSPDGRYLVFISTGKVGHHNGCHKVMIMEWPNGDDDVDESHELESRALVDKVWPYDIVAAKGDDHRYSDDMPGIFASHLELKCWGQIGQNKQYVLINTNWRSTQSVVAVSVPDGRVQRLIPYQDEQTVGHSHVYESVVMIDHNPSTNHVLAYQSSPTKPYQLLLGKLSLDKGDKFSVEWQLVEDVVKDVLPRETAELLHKMKWSVEYVPCGSDSDDDKVSPWFESILLEPASGTDTDESRHPLIVLPHGGPHSCTTTHFSIHNAYLASLGYMFICPNYRGSTGFGEGFVEVLPGHIGEWDVADTQNAALFACGDLEGGPKNKVDRNRVAICGGSHGGFLALHGVGQHPKFYKAAVVRNPVCNLATNVSSDITDWCFYETVQHDIHDQPMHFTPEFAKRAVESSPIHYVQNVSAHVLLLVGEADRRVPPTQSREYFYAMQAHRKFKQDGVDIGDCQMMLYPKNAHPIDMPSEEADAFISTYLWLHKYMS